MPHPVDRAKFPFVGSGAIPSSFAVWQTSLLPPAAETEGPLLRPLPGDPAAWLVATVKLPRRRAANNHQRRRPDHHSGAESAGGDDSLSATRRSEAPLVDVLTSAEAPLSPPAAVMASSAAGDPPTPHSLPSHSPVVAESAAPSQITIESASPEAVEVRPRSATRVRRRSSANRDEFDSLSDVDNASHDSRPPTEHAAAISSTNPPFRVHKPQVRKTPSPQVREDGNERLQRLEKALSKTLDPALHPSEAYPVGGGRVLLGSGAQDAKQRRRITAWETRITTPEQDTVSRYRREAQVRRLQQKKDRGNVLQNAINHYVLSTTIPVVARSGTPSSTPTPGGTPLPAVPVRAATPSGRVVNRRANLPTSEGIGRLLSKASIGHF
jgi:hypothetical protein